jgi:UDPglucose 6-dehydrogenase
MHKAVLRSISRSWLVEVERPVMEIAVFGLGKLGIPLAALFASKGHRVVGVDPNESNRMAAAGTGPLWEEEGLARLLARHRKRITTTADPFEAVAKTTMAMVIVPTPSDSRGAFSNEFLITAIKQIGTALRGSSKRYDVVVVSTVMPGSTGGPLRAELENASLRKLGPDLSLLYSPLFIALGSIIRNLRTPDLVLIGEEHEQSDPGSRLAEVLTSVHTKSPRRQIHRLPWAGAEITKLSINSFVTTKIAFANWVAQIAEGYEVNPGGVLAAIGSDTRIGQRYLSFGMPFGGPCFPRDNLAMAFVGEQLGLSGSLPRATQALNQAQQERLYQTVVMQARGGKVAVLGLAYKSGTAVTEESSGLRLAQALHENGYTVVVHDPMVTQQTLTQAHTVREAVAQAQVVVVASQSYERIDVDAETVVVNPWGVEISRRD